jgi:hypothetical protein
MRSQGIFSSFIAIVKNVFFDFFTFRTAMSKQPDKVSLRRSLSEIYSLNICFFLLIFRSSEANITQQKSDQVSEKTSALPTGIGESRMT